jgi:hypothetical protein
MYEIPEGGIVNACLAERKSAKSLMFKGEEGYA